MSLARQQARPLPRPALSRAPAPQRRALLAAPRRVALRSRSLLLCCSQPESAAQQGLPPPSPQPRLLLLRRAVLVAIVAKVVLFTPESSILSSVLLGVLGSVLASRTVVLAMLQGLGPHTKPAVSVALYLLAGLCEIGGGWLVWQALRSGRPWWWALLGSLVLVAYGFVAALQPTADFGRAFALYGAYFIVMSLGWGAVLDGFRPDRGDYIGCALVLAGAVLMTAWPRSGAASV